MFIKTTFAGGGFFGRKGGVSEGEYASLNCGYGSGDDIAKVEENRRIVSEKLTGKNLPLCTVSQYHSREVVVLEKPWHWKESPKGDAIITKEKGVIIGVLTADCVPILLHDKSSGIIGAIHAGWRGALGGVIENTLHMLYKNGGSIESVSAAIGPAIGKDSYEVGAEMREEFIKAYYKNETFFAKTAKPEKFMFDLKGFVREILEKSGVAEVQDLERDTLPDEKNYFSFRRTTLAGSTVYGRQISAITRVD